MTVEAATAAPFYADWTFWSFVAAMIAIALSQLPPLHIVFRRTKLIAEVFSEVFIAHRFGNPNAQLHIVLLNGGGRKVRVSSMAIEFKGASGQSFTVPARTYLQKQGDKDALLFTPFSLKPGDEFAHIINFFAALSRADEQHVRESIAVLRKDIAGKREELADKNETVAADDNSIAPFLRLFERQFKWLPDEYDMIVRFKTTPENAIPEQRFRFVVFESDTNQLKEILAGYKFGAGVYYDAAVSDGLIVPIQKV